MIDALITADRAAKLADQGQVPHCQLGRLGTGLKKLKKHIDKVAKWLQNNYSVNKKYE